MMFAKRLRERIRQGQITSSVRIWQRPHVRVGGLYRIEGGHILVESIREIALADVTGDLARDSGFEGLVDLLKTAKHGTGNNDYLVKFRYIAEAAAP